MRVWQNTAVKNPFREMGFGFPDVVPSADIAALAQDLEIGEIMVAEISHSIRETLLPRDRQLSSAETQEFQNFHGGGENLLSSKYTWS